MLDQWTGFLISDSLIPAEQLSTDDFAGTLANQTNLAIKGIVGIKAMSEIARLLGDTARAENYSVCLLITSRDNYVWTVAGDRDLLCLPGAEFRFVLRWATLDPSRRNLFVLVFLISYNLLSQYGQNDTWGLAYNLYADKLLGTNIFPASIYELRE